MLSSKLFENDSLSDLSDRKKKLTTTMRSKVMTGKEDVTEIGNRE
jgi:hypothetical protein